MSEWIQTNWLGLAALLVAIIGIPVGVIAARRWGNRRAKLQLAIESTRLLAHGQVSPDIKVTYREKIVEDPYLTTLWIKNIGPRDISSNAFEERLPITITGKLFQLIELETNNGSNAEIMFDSSDDYPDKTVMYIPPKLIPKGTVWMAKFLISGKSKILSTGALLDTDIVVVNVPNIALFEATVKASKSIAPWPFSIFFDMQLEKLKDSQPR